MATEFYKSIPESIKGKLEEYCKKYPYIMDDDHPFVKFEWTRTTEGYNFWLNHSTNETFPIWSDELNRFIDPPQVNTITVNADEYQAMREFAIGRLKNDYKGYRYYKSEESKQQFASITKSMGIDISEITN